MGAADVKHEPQLSALRREIEQLKERLRACQAQLDGEQPADPTTLAQLDLDALGFWAIDAQGRTTFVTQKVADLLGYAAAEMVGRSLASFAHPSCQEEVDRLHALSRHGIGERYDVTLVRQDRSCFAATLQLTPATDDDGQLRSAYALLSDAPAGRPGTEELQPGAALTGTAVDPRAAWHNWYDPSWKLIWTSPTSSELTGYSLDECQAMPGYPMSLIHEDDRARLWQLRELASHTRHTASVEVRLRCKDGSLKWLSASYQPIYDSASRLRGYRTTVRDVTERRTAEERLRDSEMRLRRVFDQSPIGAAIVAMDGRFVRINEAYCRILGYSEQELVGRVVFDVTHPEDRAAGIAGMAQLLRGEIDQYVSEKRYVRKDGALVWVRLSVRLVRDGNGSPLYQVPMIEDITDRKEQEAERERLEGALHHAQRMESIGRLAGGVSHDFNNLLTGITGHASLALASLPPEHRLRSSLTEILKAANAAATLTRQLLAFSRKQTIQPKATDLNALIARMHEMLIRLIGEDLVLETRLSDRIGRVRVDAGQFEQVIVNLVVNARDAMPDGGAVTIDTDEVVVPASGASEYAGLEPGCYVRLSVADTGVGMSEEVKRLIFEPFFTTKPKDKGTGLGLSMVYGAVRQAGGGIYVASQPGRGAVFRILLPCVDDPAEPLVQAPQEGEMPAGSETILLVEDDPALSAMLTEVLRHLGYLVLPCTSAAAALEHAAAHQGEIQLLVTDVVMPGMDGKTLAQRVTALRPGIKVLYASGYPEAVIAHRGVLDEGIHFLAKPFTPAALASRVRDLLDDRPSPPVGAKDR
jgi:PAS domain S-box-containing protein